MKSTSNNRIVMIGPGIQGLGGISRVVKIWKKNNLFHYFNIHYVESTSGKTQNKFKSFLVSFFKYIIFILHKTHCVYVHTSSYNSFRRKAIFLICAIIFRKKIILHIHPTHFHNYLAKIKGIEKIAVYAIIRKTTLIIVLTDAMKTKIKDIFPDKHIYILPNAVDIKELKIAFPVKRASNRFLYLGWYIKEKGVYELVDAIGKLVNKDIDLTMHFFGTKEIDKLKNYVIEKGLKKRIFIHEWINDSMKIKELYSSTAIVLPSYSEGIPNVILEAMATKTPIISTHVGGLKEILKDRENSIIVKVGNVEDLSEKLELCLNDSKLRKKITENAFNQAKHNYDIEHIYSKFRKILSD